MQLTELWHTFAEQLKRPGNLLVTKGNADAEARVLVIDEGQTIVELDSNGKALASHDLPDHPERDGGFLRSWSNAAGERWVLASGVAWQQVYVFDSQWKSVLSFPDETHSGIGDAFFTDLNGTDMPVVHIGYWGGRGLQAGSLDGRRLWSNRRLDHILQVGRGPDTDDARATLWCTSTRGTLMQFAADGNPIQERYVPRQSIVAFASDAYGEQHCGLSVGKAGQYTAVGFDASEELAWEYALPAGEYIEQVPRVQSVTMPDGNRAWLVVAANGSLHWLSQTGELLGRCDYGEVLTGVAMVNAGEQTLLFVSTANNLTAWKMSSAESSDSAQADSQASDGA